ncbi:MAG: N-acetylmuramoyl-L-alanine amidase [Hyphomicrobiales bacterium]
MPVVHDPECHDIGMTNRLAARRRLSNLQAKMSCHYPIDRSGDIMAMVAEHKRAWHAGVSCWEGCRDINSRSIGIEICNPGPECDRSDFPDTQMEAAMALSLDIVARYPIPPYQVPAHRDVAPQRKQDLGEKFNWRRLYESGIGLWVPPKPVVAGGGIKPGESGGRVLDLQTKLRSYGL